MVRESFKKWAAKKAEMAEKEKKKNKGKKKRKISSKSKVGGYFKN